MVWPAVTDLYHSTLPAGATVRVETHSRSPTRPRRRSTTSIRNWKSCAPDGTVVAADLDSLDGRNAVVSFVTTAPGVYTVGLKATAGTGEYLLRESYDFAISADDPNGDGTDTGNGDGDVIRLVRNGALIEEYIDGVLSQSFAYGPLSHLVVAGSALDNDTLIVDESQGPVIPPGGIVFSGSDTAGDNDTLQYVGSGGQVVTYRPSATTTGDGELDIDGRTITFTGLEPTTVSNVASYTLQTPGDADVVTVDNPVAGEFLLTGTSGGVAFESATLSDVASVTIDGLTNDAGGGDVVTFNPALNGLAQRPAAADQHDGTDRHRRRPADGQPAVLAAGRRAFFGTPAAARPISISSRSTRPPAGRAVDVGAGRERGPWGDQTISYRGLGYQDLIALNTGDGNDTTIVALTGYQVLPQVSRRRAGREGQLYLFGDVGPGRYVCRDADRRGGRGDRRNDLGGCTRFLPQRQRGCRGRRQWGRRRIRCWFRAATGWTTPRPSARISWLPGPGPSRSRAWLSVMFWGMSSLAVDTGDEVDSDSITVTPLGIPIAIDGGDPGVPDPAGRHPDAGPARRAGPLHGDAHRRRRRTDPGGRPGADHVRQHRNPGGDRAAGSGDQRQCGSRRRQRGQ